LLFSIAKPPLSFASPALPSLSFSVSVSQAPVLRSMMSAGWPISTSSPTCCGLEPANVDEVDGGVRAQRLRERPAEAAQPSVLHQPARHEHHRLAAARGGERLERPLHDPERLLVEDRVARVDLARARLRQAAPHVDVARVARRLARELRVAPDLAARDEAPHHLIGHDRVALLVDPHRLPGRHRVLDALEHALAAQPLEHLLQRPRPVGHSRRPARPLGRADERDDVARGGAAVEKGGDGGARPDRLGGSEVQLVEDDHEAGGLPPGGHEIGRGAQLVRAVSGTPGPAGRWTASKLAISCGVPSSVTVKSSRLRPTTGAPLLSVTTTSTVTSSVWAGKVGRCASGAWGKPAEG
jgi:hypothetical protein